ncbi:PulJ/GspJ family protein [Photobacterium aquae]|uniref:PulJ/GspJ family protein n=1 Tax=Photobacterium aquae TaxID=1195763 RepID=UPI000A69BC19|nr:prepilin-type N-terminal cleavage/methylation domain-containing protein [Photobacterium aquae]
MKRQQGFTIIELLVALTIFSSVLAITLTAFDQGVNTWKRSLRGMSQQQYVLKREAWFYPLFEQAISAQYVYPGGSLGAYFEGSPSEMQFISASPVLTGPGRTAAIQLRVKANGSGFNLEYRQKFNADIQRGINWGDEQWFVLLEGMKTIRFSYYAGQHLPFNGDVRSVELRYQQYYRDAPEWITHFTAKLEESLPNRVGIQFETANSQTWQWEFPVIYHSDALSPMFGRG